MNIRYLFLLVLAGFIMSCGGDDDGPEIPEERIVFSYDGENFTAPTFPAGLYEFAARFPEFLTSNAAGKSIEQVSFYLYEAPSLMYINISEDELDTIPGPILNTQMINNPTPNSWNTVTLDTPFEVSGTTAVWVGIEVTQDAQMQTVGCDAGPANANGDWLYDEENMEWATFSDRNTRIGRRESVNWNIKAILSE